MSKLSVRLAGAHWALMQLRCSLLHKLTSSTLAKVLSRYASLVLVLVPSAAHVMRASGVLSPINLLYDCAPELEGGYV